MGFASSRYGKQGNISIKMNILPKVYLFTALPTEIPRRQGSQNGINTSLDLNGSTEDPHMICCPAISKREGRPLPCLRDYQMAAQLRPLVLWCCANYAAKWKDMDFSVMGTPTQSALDCADQVKDRHLIQNPCVGHSAKLWKEVNASSSTER